MYLQNKPYQNKIIQQMPLFLVFLSLVKFVNWSQFQHKKQ